MREIKFRVWLENYHEYSTDLKCNVEEFYDSDDESHRMLGAVDVAKNLANPPEGQILEQFTGLRDKNGREIYEGDIVSIVRYGGELQTKGDIFEESGVFRVRNGYEVADTNILGQFSAKIIEVIGNIHENPELLK